MRLIDADSLISKINTDSIVGIAARIIINNQPTAYDVDKVVEILLKNEKVMEKCLEKEFDKDLVSAIKNLFRTYTESQIKIIQESIKNG